MGGGIGEAALIGAAVGGGSAALTGGDPLKGALLGGITGGVGGGISGMAAGAGGAAVGAAPVAAAGGSGVVPSGIMSLAPEAAGAAASAPSYALSAPGATGIGFTAPGSALPLDLASSGVAPASSQMGFFQGDVPTSVLGTGAQSAGAGAAKPGFMDNPLAYMKDNRFTVGASALAGAMGARKALGMPEQGAYKGSLSRYQFDPDKYQAADYGRYSAQGYAGGGIADINTSNIRNVPSISSYQGPVQTFAAGGIGQLGAYSDGGHMLKGPGDGMSDSIPASIADKKPARLADGEFVIPADVVSHLGNGSTDAGAKQLYAMMDRVRQKRTGTTKQGRQIKPQKLVPA